MENRTKKIALVSAGAILLLLMARKSKPFIEVLKVFIPEVEDFSEKPFWDKKQWSWGYGTAAGYNRNVRPTGTITRQKAFDDMLRYLWDAYRYLQPKVKVELNSNQWAALLSFSYNLGPGNAEDLIPYINRGDTTGLLREWIRYVYAGGVRMEGLVNRRNKEIALYQS